MANADYQRERRKGYKALEQENIVLRERLDTLQKAYDKVTMKGKPGRPPKQPEELPDFIKELMGRK